MANLPYTFAGQTGNIPLAYLDTNFANVQAFANTSGYVTNNAQANITSVGTLTTLTVSGLLTGSNVYADIHSGNSVSVTGNITSNNIIQGNSLTITGNVTANNIAGTITTTAQPNITSVGALTTLSVVGNITGGNLSTGIISADDVSLSGDLVVSGNATVNGTTTTINVQTLNIADKDVVVANNVATSALVDGAGILAGNPTVAYLKYTNASLGWTTANNFSIGGNLTVTGAGFASTPGNSVSNTQIATTAFVQNVVTNATGSLGTMSTQNASNVAITGGNITGGNINSLAVTSIGNNSFGTRTVSTSAPSGGSDGDIWYQVAS